MLRGIYHSAIRGAIIWIGTVVHVADETLARLVAAAALAVHGADISRSELRPQFLHGADTVGVIGAGLLFVGRAAGGR